MVIPQPIEVANIGMADSLILMVLALVVFGPRRLPQIGRQIGKLMYEFRKASNDFKFQMEEELRNAEEADRRKREEAERQKNIVEAQNAVSEAKSAAEEARNAAAEAQSAVKEAQLATWASDSAYPEQADETDAAISAEEGLRVRPPSIGEQVAAERPGVPPATEETPEASSETAETAPAKPPSDPLNIIDPNLEDRIARESSTRHG